ncbi:hypothetical protein BJX76DRAFT_81484 [Aspergillus varians]
MAPGQGKAFLSSVAFCRCIRLVAQSIDSPAKVSLRFFCQYCLLYTNREPEYLTIFPVTYYLLVRQCPQPTLVWLSPYNYISGRVGDQLVVQLLFNFKLSSHLRT